MKIGAPKPQPEENKRSPVLASQDDRPVVSVARAAQLLGKSNDTIYRWLNEGTLAGRKVGGRWLVYRHSVEARWSEAVVEPR